MTQQKIVPELYVTNTLESLKFYVDICGFQVKFSRPEEGFAYLEREGAELMLDELGSSRDWITGDLERPFGRGINFQIEVSDVDTLYKAVLDAGLKPFLPMEEKWYRANDKEVGNRQFLITDPDGYLLRFFQDLGERPA